MQTDLTTPPDVRLAELAARQDNAVSLAQLLGLGFGRGAVKYRLQRGRLHLIHRGVYAVGQPNLGPRGRLWAAHLRAGPDSVVSHWSAAWLWRLTPNRGRVEVTCPRKVAAEFTTHRGTPSTTHLDGLPLTTWPRTLIDIAPTTTDRTIERALNEAEVHGYFDLTALAAEVRRCNGHQGVPRVASAAERMAEGDSVTESELEELFLHLTDELGLPRPRTQVWLHGYRADFYWPEFNLVVELDGSAHRTRQNFERDRAKDAAFLRAGLRTLRVTYKRLASGRTSEDLIALTAARAA
jgi:very-short-patch-repair endonuclease